jgi:hypothetical protein
LVEFLKNTRGVNPYCEKNFAFHNFFYNKGLNQRAF